MEEKLGHEAEEAEEAEDVDEVDEVGEAEEVGESVEVATDSSNSSNSPNPSNPSDPSDRYQNAGLALNYVYDSLMEQARRDVVTVRSVLPGFVKHSIQWSGIQPDMMFEKQIWFYDHNDMLGHMSDASFFHMFRSHRIDEEHDKPAQNVLQWAIHSGWKVKPCFAICGAPWHIIESIIETAASVLGYMRGGGRGQGGRTKYVKGLARDVRVSAHLMTPLVRERSSSSASSTRSRGSGGSGGSGVRTRSKTAAATSSTTRKRKKQSLSDATQQAGVSRETHAEEGEEVFSVWVTCVSDIIFPSMEVLKLFVHGTLASLIPSEWRHVLHLDSLSVPVLGFNYRVQNENRGPKTFKASSSASKASSSTSKASSAYIYHVADQPVWLSFQKESQVDQMATSATHYPLPYMLKHCPYLCTKECVMICNDRLPYQQDGDAGDEEALRHQVCGLFQGGTEVLKLHKFEAAMFYMLIAACKDRGVGQEVGFVKQKDLLDVYVHFVQTRLGIVLHVNQQDRTIQMDIGSICGTSPPTQVAFL